MKSTSALRACAWWLARCLELGWQQSDMDALEEIWWRFHDDGGNLRNAT